MTTITVSFDQQYRIWEAAAEDENRPVLTCVLIDPSGVLVAANGFILGIVKADVGGLDKPVLVKAEAFETAASVRNLAGRARLVLDVEARRCTVGTGTHESVWPFHDGAFPNWHALIPDLSKLTFGIPVGGYSATLVAKAQAVTGGLGVTGAGLGASHPFVYLDMEGQAMAAVMPMFYDKDRVMAVLRKTYQNLGLLAEKKESVNEPVKTG